MFLNNILNKIYEIVNDLSFHINLISQRQTETSYNNRKNAESIDLHIKEIHNDISDTKSELYTEIKSNNNLLNDIIKISDKGLYDTNKIIETLNGLANTDKAIIDLVKNINELYDKRETELVKKLCNKIQERDDKLKEKDDEITSLVASIQALAEGIYNREHVEFFALKTYRGWRYICFNGEAIDTFNDVNCIDMHWDKERDTVGLTVTKKEA